MHLLIQFLQKNKFFLYFLLLEFIAFFLIISNNQFHKSKVITSANKVTSYFYKQKSTISNYFLLESQNDSLIKENLILKNKLQSLQDFYPTFDSIKRNGFEQKFTFTNAKIIKNDYTKAYNYLTIDKGKNQNIYPEMGVVNHLGIIGIVEKTTSNNARVQSILNRNTKLNARLKNGLHFGTLTWNTKDYNVVQLIDLPRQSIVKEGDTIVTGGKSSIFPEGILIGKVIGIDKKKSTSKVVEVQLFNDMSAIKNIYIIKSLYKAEIDSLQNNE